MSFFDTITDYKSGKLTDEQFKAEWEKFNTLQYNGIKKNVAGDFGANSIDELAQKIRDMQEASERAKGLPELQSKYEKEIETYKAKIQELEAKTNNDINGLKNQYNTEIENIKKMYLAEKENNFKNKVRAELTRYAAEIGIDPELRERFAEMLINDQTVQLGYDDKLGEYYAKTKEISYNDRDLPVKKVFEKDEIKTGIEKLYGNDVILQKMFPRVEQQKSGNNFLSNNSKVNTVDDMVKAMENMNVHERRQFYIQNKDKLGG